MDPKGLGERFCFAFFVFWVLKEPSQNLVQDFIDPIQVEHMMKFIAWSVIGPLPWFSICHVSPMIRLCFKLKVGGATSPNWGEVVYHHPNHIFRDHSISPSKGFICNANVWDSPTPTNWKLLNSFSSNKPWNLAMGLGKCMSFWISVILGYLNVSNVSM